MLLNAGELEVRIGYEKEERIFHLRGASAVAKRVILTAAVLSRIFLTISVPCSEIYSFAKCLFPADYPHLPLPSLPLYYGS